MPNTLHRIHPETIARNVVSSDPETGERLDMIDAEIIHFARGWEGEIDKTLDQDDTQSAMQLVEDMHPDTLSLMHDSSDIERSYMATPVIHGQQHLRNLVFTAMQMQTPGESQKREIFFGNTAEQWYDNASNIHMLNLQQSRGSRTFIELFESLRK